MNQELDSEISILLKKYAGGKIPPLVNADEAKLGLIDIDILQRYHRGTMELSKLPLGILLAAEWFESSDGKWLYGDFTLNKWSRSHWPAYCKKIREKEVGNQICEACDRHRASMAENSKKAVAYLCDSGLIDFAVPIKVNKQVIAIMFCGQYRPQKGFRWNREIIQPNGNFIFHGQITTGIDAWEESQKRIQRISEQIDLPNKTLMNLLSDKDYPVEEISPEKVSEILKQIDRIAEELSSLATSTYELEKGQVVNFIRNKIAQSLQPLSIKSEENVAVWEGLAHGLEYIIKFFEFDYSLIISSCKGKGNTIKVLCQAGVLSSSIRIGDKFPLKEEDARRLKSVCSSKELSTIGLREYKKVAFFEKLYDLHIGKKNKNILAIPISGPPGGESLLMLLGSFDHEIATADSNGDIHKTLKLFKSDIELVVQAVLLIERLEEEARKRDLFVEDIGHDIRNPIQNMLVTSAVLASDSMNIDIIKNAAKRLAAQVRHLSNISQRVWTLSSIDSGTITSAQAEQVVIYQTLTEIRKSLSTLANEREIEIRIDEEMQSWPRILVNKSLFWDAVLNLTENAIKYSMERTEIRVDGKRLPTEVTISWVDRGIPVLEEDKEQIFERYFRARNAVQHTQVGRGIGLYIVKTFIDDCKGHIEVKSLPIKGTQDYVTEFKLSIPTRRW
jgi:signal transduction histidine kinase